MHLQHTYALSRGVRVINPYQIYVTITVLNSGYHSQLFCRTYTRFMRLSEFEYPDFYIENAVQLSAVKRRQMRRIRLGFVKNSLQFKN